MGDRFPRSFSVESLLRAAISLPLVIRKNGVAKNKRTRLLFFKFPTEAVTMGSLTWEMFLGLFQIILRRLALSENEHSAFGLTFESHL